MDVLSVTLPISQGSITLAEELGYDPSVLSKSVDASRSCRKHAKMLHPLFPANDPLPLQGAYLDLPLRSWAQMYDGLFTYSNFISSLDGRISLPDQHNHGVVPASIGNPRDWRLYQELAAHADVLITSARYYRQWADGRHQGDLPVASTKEFEDIHAWRSMQGLPPQPDIMIISRSLDIPAEPLQILMSEGRKVHIACCAQSPKISIENLRQLGVFVHVCGEKQVEALPLRDTISKQGYAVACMVAGPEVHSTLLQAGVIQHLFLTLRNSITGGNSFHTISSGNWSRARYLQLHSMFQDNISHQQFISYRVIAKQCL